MKPLVYIIVLNWNSEQNVCRNIKYLTKLDFENFKIVIVDNNSPDGSGNRIKERFPSVHFIQTGRNLGYGDGNNFGIRYALANKADYIWILNPDMMVAIDSLTKMIEIMESDASVGIAGPRLLWQYPDQSLYFDKISIVPQNGYEIIVQKYKNLDYLDQSRYVETDAVIGCSMLIKQRVFKDVGLIRDDFFMFHEEMEFCIRARRNGWKIILCRNVENKHEWMDEGKNNLAKYYFPRNIIYIARLQKKYVVTTIFKALKLRSLLGLFRRGSFREASNQIKPIVDGICTPLNPVKFIDK